MDIWCLRPITSRLEELARSEIGRKIIDDLCLIVWRDVHPVGGHFRQDIGPPLARQSGRADDHTEVVTRLTLARDQFAIRAGWQFGPLGDACACQRKHDAESAA